jgi:hypothetical protein
VSVDIPLPVLSDQDESQEPPIVYTPNLLNMSILPTAVTVLSDTVQLTFHHFSLHPMTHLQERLETVRDACQTELQVDLVASLLTASVF